MSDQDNQDESDGVSRRDLFKLGALGSGVLAYSGMATDTASAQTTPDEPVIVLGPEDDPFGYVYEDGDDLVLEHQPSGAQFTYDAANGAWNAPNLTTDTLQTEGVRYSPIVGQTSVETYDVDNNPTTDVKRTPDVGTTATTIFAVPSDNGAGVIDVFGKRTDDDGASAFIDRVSIIFGNSPTVISSNGRSIAATRTYSEASNRNLQLKMGSDTYNIICIGQTVAVLDT